MGSKVNAILRAHALKKQHEYRQHVQTLKSAGTEKHDSHNTARQQRLQQQRSAEQSHRQHNQLTAADLFKQRGGILEVRSKHTDQPSKFQPIAGNVLDDLSNNPLKANIQQEALSLRQGRILEDLTAPSQREQPHFAGYALSLGKRAALLEAAQERGEDAGVDLSILHQVTSRDNNLVRNDKGHYTRNGGRQVQTAFDGLDEDLDDYERSVNLSMDTLYEEDAGRRYGQFPDMRQTAPRSCSYNQNKEDVLQEHHDEQSRKRLCEQREFLSRVYEEHGYSALEEIRKISSSFHKDVYEAYDIIRDNEKMAEELCQQHGENAGIMLYRLQRFANAYETPSLREAQEAYEKQQEHDFESDSPEQER